jgi:hypothetical protein
MEEEKYRDQSNSIADCNREPVQDALKTQPVERKVSKRREAQEEKSVVMDLFRDLISSINEGKVPLTQPSRK